MPDAWDDDWIQKTESKPTTPDPPASSTTKTTKAERRAKQAEFNRQLWADAETEQGENFFLKTQGVVPLKSEFKPAVKVLSRKPILARGTNTAGGIGQLSLDDDDDDDEPAKVELTPEERKAKAQKEREEKQKAYEERRRQLFGPDSSGNAVSSRRGGGASPRNQSRANRANGDGSRPASSANSARQLFDPSESTKPESLRPAKAQNVENSPIRQPRAPDGSGRGGFGFTTRGGHAG